TGDAELLPRRCRRAREDESAFRSSRLAGQYGHPLEHTCHAPPVTETQKRAERLAVTFRSSRPIAMFTGDGAEIGDRTGDAPGITEESKGVQRHLVELGRVIPKLLVSRDAALVTQQPGTAQPVTVSTEDDRRL